MKLNSQTVAAITGVASGIGRALALRLAREGVALALNDVNEAGLHETGAAVEKLGVACSLHACDVSREEQVNDFAREALARHGRVSLLVNNAGVALAGTVEELSTADIVWLMGINFWGTVYGVKAFLPHLRAEPQAHIVNVSSVFGFIAPPGHAAYVASKFAVRGFTEALRHELAGTNVRVSVVHPGGVRTGIARAARRGLQAPAARHEEEVTRFERVARTTPEAAAERIVRGITRDEGRILIGTDARFIELVQRLRPVHYWRLLQALEQKFMK